MEASKSRLQEEIARGEEVAKVLMGNGRPPDITFGKDDERKLGRVNIADREYEVEGIKSTWTVVKVGSGATILPILDVGGNRYIVMVYKPHPSVKSWSLELPAGGVDANETTRQAAIRELGEETGYQPRNVKLFMRNMHFMPSRVEQREDVYIATNLVEGKRNLEYEEKPMKVCLLTEDQVRALLEQNKIQDFRTVAVLSQYFLREQYGVRIDDMKHLLRGNT